MREITLKIPDHKIQFFIQLVNELGIEIADEYHIREEHKSIVRERIKTANKNIPWDEARKKLDFS